MTTNYSYTVRNMNFFQGTAPTKSNRANFRDAVRDINALKGNTAIECRFSNTRNAVRDIYALQGAATTKSFTTNFSDTFRYSYGNDRLIFYTYNSLSTFTVFQIIFHSIIIILLNFLKLNRKLKWK